MDIIATIVANLIGRPCYIVCFCCRGCK